MFTDLKSEMLARCGSKEYLTELTNRINELEIKSFESSSIIKGEDLD